MSPCVFPGPILHATGLSSAAKGVNVPLHVLRQLPPHRRIARDAFVEPRELRVDAHLLKFDRLMANDVG